MQERLGTKKYTISIRTARRWLKKLDWRYGRKRSGMYIDGHEREDVVAYRSAFIDRWKSYEKRMVMYDNDGKELPRPAGFEVAQIGRFRLIPITHDESTFHGNDRRNNYWIHVSDEKKPQPKGEGASIMVSDFLTSEWGRLVDGDEYVSIVFT
jgi:hypothetical protein